MDGYSESEKIFSNNKTVMFKVFLGHSDEALKRTNKSLLVLHCEKCGAHRLWDDRCPLACPPCMQTSPVSPLLLLNKVK